VYVKFPLFFRDNFPSINEGVFLVRSSSAFLGHPQLRNVADELDLIQSGSLYLVYAACCSSRSFYYRLFCYGTKGVRLTRKMERSRLLERTFVNYMSCTYYLVYYQFIRNFFLLFISDDVDWFQDAIEERQDQIKDRFLPVSESVGKMFI
jgi:hypothetical protein